MICHGCLQYVSMDMYIYIYVYMSGTFIRKSCLDGLDSERHFDEWISMDVKSFLEHLRLDFCELL